MPGNTLSCKIGNGPQQTGVLAIFLFCLVSSFILCYVIVSSAPLERDEQLTYILQNNPHGWNHQQLLDTSQTSIPMPSSTTVTITDILLIKNPVPLIIVDILTSTDNLLI